jgi:hypothetical protein
MTMVLSVPPEAPFVVVVAAEEEELYFSPPRTRRWSTFPS